MIALHGIHGGWHTPFSSALWPFKKALFLLSSKLSLPFPPALPASTHRDAFSLSRRGAAAGKKFADLDSTQPLRVYYRSEVASAF